MSEKIYKSIKYRIFPTDEQKQILERHFGASRFVWNYLINLIFETDYTSNDQIKNPTTVISMRNYIRKNGPEWIRTGSNYINGTVVENACLRFKVAFDNYKIKTCPLLKKGVITDKYKPMKKSKKDFRKYCIFNRKNDTSFKIEDGLLNINITKGYDRQTFITKKKITIESKNIKQVVFNMIDGKYYMGLVYETQVEKPLYDINSKIGIDLGVKTSMVCYDGSKISKYELPDKVIRLRDKVEKANSLVSKSKKDSKRNKQLTLRKHKAFRRMVNYKNNWQDLLVDELCRNYKNIIIDDMPNFYSSKNREKHYMNYKLATISPGRFKSRLEKKSQILGNSVVILNKAPTTQTCSNCGNVKKDKEKLTLEDRTYECSCCGLSMDRDENSAINIYNYSPIQV